MSVAVYDGVFGGLALREIVNTDYKPEFKDAGYRQSGAIYRTQSVITSGEPMVDVESMDLYGIVGLVDPSSGMAITFPGTITIPWQVRAAGGMFVSNGNNYSISSTLGLLVPDEISASQDSEAGVTIKYKIYLASSDGIAAPVAFNSSVTLGSQAFNESYSMGPAKIDSTFIEGLKSWTYRFGITVKVDRYGGGVFPTMAGITISEVNPEMDFTFEDMASASSFGHYASITTATAFARKNVHGGTRVADATSGHFSATITGGIHILQGLSGKGTDNGSFTRTIKGHTQAFSRAAAIA